MAQSSKSLFPALDSPQRQGNATGSGRSKVALPKGRSLMDWIRLGNSGADLTGVGGKLIRVTPADLKKHNTREDCWMAIGGAVYNITQYCEFHPGGIEEIMKGAGKDGTQLFNEVHRWVNYESMLKKCLVGKLVSEGIFNRAPQYGNQLVPPRAMGTTMSTVNKPQVDQQSSEKSTPFTLPFSKPATPNKPRYDYYQNDSTVKVSIYTRIPGVSSDNLVLERPGGNVKISLYLPSGKLYRLHLAPAHPLLLSCQIKSAKTIGKVELDFPKSEVGLKWTKLGEFLNEHNSLLDGSTGSSRDYIILSTITKVQAITHDTNIYNICLPAGCHMTLPVGYHVRLKTTILGMTIERSYTPVCQLNKPSEDSSGSSLDFIIKIYEDGAFTQYLKSLNSGDCIPMSHLVGHFNVSQLEPYTSTLLLAAGTGFTPMTKLITYCLAQGQPVHLVFFNKTEADVIWRQELDTLADGRSFTVTYILSQPESSWTGMTGRLTSDMLHHFLPAATLPKTFIAACGPIPFIQLCQKHLNDLHCSEEQVHIFEE